jgi:arsenate reductase (thioredoxin)
MKTKNSFRLCSQQRPQPDGRSVSRRNLRESFSSAQRVLEPGKLNRLAVEAMREIGVDISKNRTQSVVDIFKSGPVAAGLAYVVTVCDESSAERCRIFPGGGEAIAREFSRSSRAPAARMKSA